MLGSESIEEMFDQPDWSEEDLDEKYRDENSDSMLRECEKDDQYSQDGANTKNAGSEYLNLSFREIVKATRS